MNRTLSPRGRLGVAVLCFGLMTPALAGQLRNVKPGEPVPAFSAPGLNGGPIASKDAEGKVLILVYVSPHQQQSEEALASAHRVVKEISNDDLYLVFMSASPGQADYFKELRERVMAHEPFAFDDGRKYYGQLGMFVYPTTVVTSKQGKLLQVISSWTREYEYALENYCRHALGEIDDAELTKRMTAKVTKKDDARAKADRHRSVAAILRSKGMLDNAARELEQAIAVDPTSSDAVVELVEILVAQKKLEDAESRVRKLLERDPSDHGGKLMLGVIQLKRGKLDEAETLLKESLKLNPEPIRPNYYLGQLYEQKGQHELAMIHYRDALKQALKEP